MEKINGSALWYYLLSPEYYVTVRYVVYFKEPIDGDALRKAADITAKRYPYMMKKVVINGEDYCLEDNPLPIVVKNTHHSIPLCGSEANFHQIALSYADRTLYFNNTHAICDGRGRSQMLHTLVYYYCTLRYGESFEMPDVTLADSPIDAAEDYDALAMPIPEAKYSLPRIPAVSNVMNLADQGLVHKSKINFHHLRVNEKQLMSLCKSTDSTPNSAISILMCRAIDKLHPDHQDSIVAGVYCDVRKVLGAEKSHHSLVTTISLEYSPVMRDMSFSEQNTVFRGKILLGSEECHLLQTQREAKQLAEKLNALPTLEEKRNLAKGALNASFTGNTFLVSYSGKSSFGTCDKHLEAVFPQTGASNMCILIEVAVADGWFYLTFLQPWMEDVYFNAFLKEIMSVGLDFDLLYSSLWEPAGISFE